MPGTIDHNYRHQALGISAAAGLQTHEVGGLEANVSAYSGVPKISGGATSNLKINFAASAAPDADDDTGEGYIVGSLWLDTTNDEAYICLDNTSSAAVWKRITLDALADFASGTLAHERGGLEADVSAFSGLAKILSGSTTELKINFAASAAPAATDDGADGGYSVGSLWLDTTNDEAYICMDATDDAAVWKQISVDSHADLADWTVTASTTPTAAWGDRLLCTGDNAQVTLPDPASNGGKVIEVISTHANGADLIRNGSENINGAASDQVVTQYERYTVISDGTNYIVNWNGVA